MPRNSGYDRHRRYNWRGQACRYALYELGGAIALLVAIFSLGSESKDGIGMETEILAINRSDVLERIDVDWPYGYNECEYHNLPPKYKYDVVFDQNHSFSNFTEPRWLNYGFSGEVGNTANYKAGAFIPLYKRNEVRLLTVFDCHVARFGGIFVEGQLYFLWKSRATRCANQQVMKVVYRCSDVLVVSREVETGIGHLLRDVVGWICLVPERVRSVCYVAMGADNQLVRQGLDLVFDPSRVVFLNQSEAVFAARAYLIVCHPYTMSLHVWPWSAWAPTLKFRDLLRRKFRFFEMSPTNHTLVQRLPNDNRVILNSDDVLRVLENSTGLEWNIWVTPELAHLVA